jgi:hypothetical protein
MSGRGVESNFGGDQRGVAPPGPPGSPATGCPDTVTPPEDLFPVEWQLPAAAARPGGQAERASRG